MLVNDVIYMRESTTNNNLRYYRPNKNPWKTRFLLNPDYHPQKSI